MYQQQISTSTHSSRRRKCPRAQPDFYERARRIRDRHLRRLAAKLPFAIDDTQRGLGVILKPKKRRGSWASEPDFYFVQFKTGVEVRMHEGEKGCNGFYSWNEINKDIREHETQRAVMPWALRPYPLYGHVWRMWH